MEVLQDSHTHYKGVWLRATPKLEHLPTPFLNSNSRVVIEDAYASIIGSMESVPNDEAIVCSQKCLETKIHD